MLLLREPYPRASWGWPILLVAGCASREVPARYPDSSAASPHAPSAQPLNVVTSLQGDEPVAHQEADAGASEGHAHHHGHDHGH